MGGQTALNMAIQLEKKGILKKHKVELIGANSRAISNAEDREKFRKNMKDIGIDLPKSKIVTSIKEAKKALKKVTITIIFLLSNLSEKYPMGPWKITPDIVAIKSKIDENILSTSDRIVLISNYKHLHWKHRKRINRRSIHIRLINKKSG